MKPAGALRNQDAFVQLFQVEAADFAGRRGEIFSGMRFWREGEEFSAKPMVHKPLIKPYFWGGGAH